METLKTFFYLVLYVLGCLAPVYCGNGYVSIHDSNQFELTGDPRTYICGPNIQLMCNFINDNFGIGKQIQWIQYTDNGGTNIIQSAKVGSNHSSETLSLLLRSSGHYACQYLHKSATTLNITVVRLQNGIIGCQDTHPISTTPVMRPSSVATTTLVTTGTPSASPRTHTNTSHFVGLNPLIYTTITAILLVVLTLVAIVTCWLRSRKMSPQRTLLPQETPQDYLDYIREGQFTPLTTSELLASLHERPPTYIESQDIQRRMENDDNETPPPLPLRNMTRREMTSPTTSNESNNNNPTPTSPAPSSPQPLVVQEVTLQDPSIDMTLQDPSMDMTLPDPSINITLPELLVDSSQEILLLDPSELPTLQDPLMPLLEPIFLQDPPQSDEHIEDVDENAPLINNL